MRRFARYAVVVVAAGTLMGGLLADGGAAVAKKAAKPKLKVSPKSKLTNGEAVQVSGSHMTAGDQVYVVECVLGQTSLTGAGCDTNSSAVVGPETVSPQGTFGPVTFKVITGKIGTTGATCGTTKADAKACAVSAGTATGGDAVQVKIKFTVPK